MSLKSILSLLLIFISSAAPASLVIIDPGHGGNDQGAAYYNIKESDIVLQIASKIKQHLTTSTEAPKVFLTREKNNYVSLEKRIDFQGLSPLKPDLFVSLHANSSTLKSIKGMEVYFQTDKKNKTSLKLVDDLVEELKQTALVNQSLKASLLLQKNWSTSHSVIRRSGFYVLENSDVPSLLIEMGFLSNIEEARELQNSDHQADIAKNIAEAILDYLKTSQPR